MEKRKNITSNIKVEIVLVLLRGENPELISREYGVTLADINLWRDQFIESGADGFKVSIEKNRTRFEDVKMTDFMGFPIINEKGERIGDPSSTFCSKEKLKKIECDLYTQEERNFMLMNYKQRATVIVRANNGSIVSASFTFDNLTDPSVIDTKKLKRLKERIMTELTFENLLFNGQQAVSGYMLAPIWFFRP